jgi:HSP20 family protein
MRAMEQQMNRLMKDNMIDFNPREDVKQTTDHYIINMDLPGMEKDKINVEVKSGALIVSGERSSEVKEDKPHQYYRQERSFGHFYRSIPLPGDALSDNIDAQYQNGVLTVKIARNKSKSKEADTQKIKIK